MKTSPILAVAFLSIAAMAAAQDATAPTLLIISQPAQPAKRGDFVDMGYYIERAVSSSGKYQAIRLQPGTPSIAAAIGAKKLTLKDIELPVSVATARRIASASGAVYVLTVSGLKTRAGVSADAQMEALRGAETWTTVFTTSMAPYKGLGRKVSMLDAINAHVSSLMQRITGERPAALSVDGGTTPPKQDRPTGPANTVTPTTPNAPSTADVLIDRFRKQGDTANLIVSLRRAITDRPRDPSLRRDLIAAYRGRGWVDAAADEAARAVQLVPGSAVLRRLHGQALVDSGDVAGAIADLSEAVRLGPTDAENHIALGDAYWADAKTDLALQAYSAGAVADPSSPLPHRRLARYNLQRLKLKEASASMAAALKASTDSSLDDYAADYIALIGTAETMTSDALATMQRVRKDFLNGVKTREEAHTEIAAQRDRANALGLFFGETPPPDGYSAAQALYAQAAELAAQSSEDALAWLETQSDTDDKHATLLRIEAGRKLTEAAKKLKAAAAQRKSS